DQSIVAAVDSSSRVLAFNRKTGDALWSNDTLFLRRLTAPISMDRAIWVADMDGYLHGLSREDGKLIARQRLDGGRPSGAMVLTRAGLLVQTEGGRLNLLRP
ncbi:MAG: outer membrane protein assembly factor BamB, partial [Betaproteobacteria bacterium]|nr:outer membrane protein assembly factor BamB [Betaproteobacteria bacterium]